VLLRVSNGHLCNRPLRPPACRNHALRAHAHAAAPTPVRSAYAPLTQHEQPTPTSPNPAQAILITRAPPMTIHSSRVGCRYVLYSRSVRFAWAPSRARKVKMRKHGACTFARSEGSRHVLAPRNHAAYAPVCTLRACVRTVITFPYARCVHAYAACRPTARPSRTEPAHQTRWSDRSRADASALRSAGRLVHAKYVVHSC